MIPVIEKFFESKDDLLVIEKGWAYYRSSGKVWTRTERIFYVYILYGFYGTKYLDDKTTLLRINLIKTIPCKI